MEELENFTKESLIVLQKYNQLKPLIKSIQKTKDINTIEVKREDYEFLLNDFCAEKKLSNEKELLKWLEDNKLSKKQIIEKVSIPMRMIRYAKGKFSNQVNSYFLKRKEQLDTYIYSLIRVRDKNRADELFFRIQDEEETFSDLASKYSEGFEQETKGLVGPTNIIQAHPKISEILKSSSDGELHPPIRIDGWYIIIKLETFKPAVLDQLMEQQMVLEIYDETLDNIANTIAEDIFKNKNTLSNRNKA